jgi:hypothetical protein
MAESIIINIDCEWIKEDTDLNNCSVCEDLIVSESNNLYAFANNTLCSDRPIVRLCNSCFNGIEWQ